MMYPPVAKEIGFKDICILNLTRCSGEGYV